MRAGHPDQVRLAQFLDHVEAVLEPDVSAIDTPLALRYDVGVPPERERFGGGDLDNYAFPVARRLGPGRIASFRVSKRTGGTSTVAVGPAGRASGDLLTEWCFAAARPTASPSTSEWKREV